jgi:hypothetical protein
MKRRGATQLAAPALRVHSADGRNGSANTVAALPKNNRRDLLTLMESLQSLSDCVWGAATALRPVA